MAIRAASIWRSVIHAGSRLLSPYSPKLISLPRVATPVMRPRICFRCLTFFGINMMFHHFEFRISNFEIRNLLLVLISRSSTIRSAFTSFTLAARTRASLAFADARFVDRIGAGAAGHRRFRIENLAAVDPDLDSDLSERRLGFGETVIDVRAERVQRKLSDRKSTRLNSSH